LVEHTVASVCLPLAEIDHMQGYDSVQSKMFSMRWKAGSYPC